MTTGGRPEQYFHRNMAELPGGGDAGKMDLPPIFISKLRQIGISYVKLYESLLEIIQHISGFYQLADIDLTLKQANANV